MEEKINKAAILKDKPKGTKLYTILSDSECFLNEASEDSIYIDIDNRERFWCLSAYGSTHSFPNGCVLLFPSKEMRDWSKFAWKKGDVLVSNDGGTEVVFDKWYDETYTSFYCKHYLNSEDENKIVYLETFLCTTERYSLEDKDSVQTYINTIEERLGGKLNGETLEIEKAEFKYGDIAFMIDNKKMEEAARLDDEEYYDSLSDNDRCFFEYVFRRGYNRALKELLHPASEVPRNDNGKILAFSKVNSNMNAMLYETACYTYQGKQEVRVREYTFTDLAFVEDLLDLIKKGGKHD